MTIDHMWYVALGSLVGSVVFFVATLLQRFRPRKSKPAEPSELDALVQQERWKQATPVAIAAAMQWPVDVKALTLIFHYEDGHQLHMECGKPERMEVEP